MYSDSNKLHEFVKKNEENLDKKNNELEKDNEQKEKKKENLLKEFEKTKCVTKVAALVIIIAVLLFILIKTIWLSVIFVVLIVVLSIIFIKKRKKWLTETKGLQHGIERNKRLINENEKRKKMFENKSFAAWKVMKSLYENWSFPSAVNAKFSIVTAC